MDENKIAGFLTAKVMNYLDEPKVVRQARKKANKVYKKPFLEHWFGVLPFSLHIWYSQTRQIFRQYFSDNT